MGGGTGGGIAAMGTFGVYCTLHRRCMERIDFKWSSFPKSSRRRGAALDGNKTMALRDFPLTYPTLFPHLSPEQL